MHILYVFLLFQILREVEESIQDTEHISAGTRSDLKQLKYALRTSLYDYIDDFSFRILSNIDRDMEYVKSTYIFI